MRKRKDASQSGIVKELKKYPGIAVVDISNFGGGIGDLLIGFRRRNYLFEIKNPQQKITYTPAERKFHDTWSGQVDIAQLADDILKAIGYL